MRKYLKNGTHLILLFGLLLFVVFSVNQVAVAEENEESFGLSETGETPETEDVPSLRALLPNRTSQNGSEYISSVSITKSEKDAEKFRVIVTLDFWTDLPAGTKIEAKDLENYNGRINFQKSSFLPAAVVNSTLYATVSKDVVVGGKTITATPTQVFLDFDHLSYQERKETTKEGVEKVLRDFSFYFGKRANNTVSFTDYGFFSYEVPEGLITPPNNNPPLVLTPDPDPIREESSEPIQIATLKPHLLVESYTYGSSVVTAGQDFTFTVRMKNYHRSKTIENVVIIITPSEGLQIKSATNTYYIDHINAGDVVSKTITLRVPIGTEVNVQNVTVKSTFQYYDKKNEDPVESGDEIVLAIPSTSINRAKITSIKFPKKFKEGKKATIEYGFVNNGFTKLYNAEAFLYDEKGAEIGWQYIGNLDSGSKSATPTSFELELADGGERNLKLVVFYEDENLAKKSTEKEFKLDVEKSEIIETPATTPDTGGMDATAMPEGGGFEDPNMIPEQGGGKSILPWILGGAGVLVVVLIVVNILNKRKKAKQAVNYDNYFEELEAEETKEPDQTMQKEAESTTKTEE